ncbi:hypothetical protein ACFU3E_23885 [Streptomyces sp. NPDC057424]|uniref:hypothetical protein n=1 Tax=Streptomyces sp. NPDC057424 TaxID=3346127 RepID=UPI0036A5FBF6
MLRESEARDRAAFIELFASPEVRTRDTVGNVRMTGPVEELVSASELGDGAGLARSGQPGDHQAPAGADRMAIEQDQTTDADHSLFDELGSNHKHPGVMVQPVFVVKVLLDRRPESQITR